MNKNNSFFIVLLFIMFAIIIVSAYLMYGDCQTSKWHYIVQEYKMPSWLRIRDNPSHNLYSKLFGNYNGKWESWFENGNIKNSGHYANGGPDGLLEEWYENGVKSYSCLWIKGRVDSKVYKWYDDGTKKSVTSSNIGVGGLNEEYNKDGTLNKKEYYDVKGNVQKRELFEKGKLVKTEVEE